MVRFTGDVLTFKVLLLYYLISSHYVFNILIMFYINLKFFVDNSKFGISYV